MKNEKNSFESVIADLRATQEEIRKSVISDLINENESIIHEKVAILLEKELSEADGDESSKEDITVLDDLLSNIDLSNIYDDSESKDDDLKGSNQNSDIDQEDEEEYVDETYKSDFQKLINEMSSEKLTEIKKQEEQKVMEKKEVKTEDEIKNMLSEMEKEISEGEYSKEEDSMDEGESKEDEQKIEESKSEEEESMDESKSEEEESMGESKSEEEESMDEAKSEEEESMDESKSEEEEESMDEEEEFSLEDITEEEMQDILSEILSEEDEDEEESMDEAKSDEEDETMSESKTEDEEESIDEAKKSEDEEDKVEEGMAYSSQTKKTVGTKSAAQRDGAPERRSNLSESFKLLKSKTEELLAENKNLQKVNSKYEEKVGKLYEAVVQLNKVNRMNQIIVENFDILSRDKLDNIVSKFSECDTIEKSKVLYNQLNESIKKDSDKILNENIKNKVSGKLMETDSAKAVIKTPTPKNSLDEQLKRMKGLMNDNN